LTTVFLSFLFTRTQQLAGKCSQKLTFSLGRTTLFQPLDMAPKRKQKAKSSGAVSGTISTKPSNREGEAMARALKRAERAETKRVEAEKRKEAVRPLLCHQTRDATNTSHGHVFLGKRSLPRGRILRGRRGLRGGCRSTRSQCSLFVKLGRSVAQIRGVSFFFVSHV